MDTLIVKRQSLSLDIYPKTHEEYNKMARVPYASTISSLMFTIMHTRSKICYVVGLVSRY